MLSTLPHASAGLTDSISTLILLLKILTNITTVLPIGSLEETS